MAQERESGATAIEYGLIAALGRSPSRSHVILYIQNLYHAQRRRRQGFPDRAIRLFINRGKGPLKADR